MTQRTAAPLDRAKRGGASDEHVLPQFLNRGLKRRHIQLISIGGTIGVGLFLGSATAIQTAGPALLLDYALSGVIIFFLLRALGELLLNHPVAGSFAEYAEEFVGPFAGFVTGWSYWFMWIVTCMAEATAVGIYLHYWFPQLRQWVGALGVVLCLFWVNLRSVNVFGEIEYWFALIKVITVVALLIVGFAVLVLHVGICVPGAAVSNLWNHGGFFPFGVAGMCRALQGVMFAYSGVEMIGITASEVENPERVLARAINNVFYRILIFYLGALFVLMCLAPWTTFSRSVSPFVFLFQKLGIPSAANVVNFVVITAASSACNSGIYCTGRMLFTLGQNGHAPALLGAVNSQHVPIRGITLSTLVMLVGVVLNYLVPREAFAWLTSIALVGTLWTWGIIMFAHRGYRRAIRRGLKTPGSFTLPGAPVTTWVVIGGVFFTAALLWLNSETRIALYVAPVWFGILGVSYWKHRVSGV